MNEDEMKWISIKERLPETDKNVVIHCRTGDKGVGYYSVKKSQWFFPSTHTPINNVVKWMTQENYDKLAKKIMSEEDHKEICNIDSGENFYAFSINIPIDKISFEIMDSVSEWNPKGTRVIIRQKKNE